MQKIKPALPQDLFNDLTKVLDHLNIQKWIIDRTDLTTTNLSLITKVYKQFADEKVASRLKLLIKQKPSISEVARIIQIECNIRKKSMLEEKTIKESLVGLKEIKESKIRLIPEREEETRSSELSLSEICERGSSVSIKSSLKQVFDIRILLDGFVKENARFLYEPSLHSLVLLSKNLLKDFDPAHEQEILVIFEIIMRQVEDLWGFHITQVIDSLLLLLVRRPEHSTRILEWLKQIDHKKELVRSLSHRPSTLTYILLTRTSLIPSATFWPLFKTLLSQYEMKRQTGGSEVKTAVVNIRKGKGEGSGEYLFDFLNRHGVKYTAHQEEVLPSLRCQYILSTPNTLLEIVSSASLTSKFQRILDRGEQGAQPAWINRQILEKYGYSLLDKYVGDDALRIYIFVSCNYLYIPLSIPDGMIDENGVIGEITKGQLLRVLGKGGK